MRPYARRIEAMLDRMVEMFRFRAREIFPSKSNSSLPVMALSLPATSGHSKFVPIRAKRALAWNSGLRVGPGSKVVPDAVRKPGNGMSGSVRRRSVIDHAGLHHAVDFQPRAGAELQIGHHALGLGNGSNWRTRSGATAGITFGAGGFGGAVGVCAAGAGSTGFARGGETTDNSSALTSPFRVRASTSIWNSASGAALRIAFASVGASTPFMTSTPSKAVTLALPPVTAIFGVAPDAG